MIKDLKQFPKEVSYDLRSPIVLFYNYLKDMIRLKIDILDKRNDKLIGVVVINLLSILNKQVKDKDQSPFDSFTSVFPIMKQQIHPDVKPQERQARGNKPIVNYSEQIGEIEISMSCEFFLVKRQVFEQDNTKQFIQEESLIRQDQL